MQSGNRLLRFWMVTPTTATFLPKRRMAQLAALVFGVGDVPRGYSVRTADGASVGALIDAAGLKRVRRDPATGDLVLLKSGPAQCHLVVMTDAGFVHADAGIGRVVETPGPPPWPVIAIWEA
jgi:murein DD-endopeptidase / murein LD-carboxypeptidase